MEQNIQPTTTGSGSATIRSETALASFFALFLFGAAFSIALAQIALGLSLISFCVWMMITGRRPENLGPKPLYLAITAYIGWLAISSLAGNTPLSSLAALREEWLFVILPLGIFLGRRQDIRSRLMIALALGALLAGTYGIIQHFTGVYWFKSGGLHTVSGNYRLTGNFSHPLTYGYYVATVSVFLLNYLLAMYRRHARSTRFLFLAATLTSLTSAALCMSRGPLLALIVGLIATALIRRRFSLLITGSLLAFVLAWIVTPGFVAEFSDRVNNDFKLDNHSSRLYIWSQSWQIIKDNPVTGVGLGNFAPTYSGLLPADAATHEHQGHAHNDFLNLAATIGTPGLLGYLAIWGIVMVRLWHRSRDDSGSPPGRALATAALVASIVFCTASLTEAAFADEELRQLITALWAFGLSDG